MQKNYFLLLCLLILFSFSSKSQNLIYNQYNTVLLDTGWYTSVIDADTFFDFAITVQPVINPLATGMKTVAVITGITLPQGTPASAVYTTTGTLGVGDSLPFDTTSAYPIYMDSAVVITFDYLAIGTPTILNEAHYCNFQSQVTLAAFLNTYQLITIDQNKDCFVDGNLSIHCRSAAEWEVFPNPVVDRLIVRNVEPSIDYEFLNLFNLQGKLVHSWGFGEILDFQDLGKGIYMLEIHSDLPVENRKILFE